LGSAFAPVHRRGTDDHLRATQSRCG
jgi:hypothetical protein